MHGPPRPTPGLHGTGSLPVRGTRAPKLDLDRRRDMPELPEVETTVRGLARYLEGERIARIAVNRPDLRRPFPPGLVQAMTGATVTAMGRRAKYGLIHTDREQTMIFHLGMSGRWRIEPETLEKHDHLVIETGSGHVLALNDARRFGLMDLVASDTAESHPLLSGLGPEPLGNAFHAAGLAAAFHGRRAPVKAALLDQRIVAGLGNIYVCESLFRAGISPRRAAGRISAARIAALVTVIRQVLEQAIEAGGSSLRDYRQTGGELGYFQHAFDVYGREGGACQRPGCHGVVGRIVQSGRSSFFCPQCQR